MIYDVLIIGAGPAGLSAAIYTGRNRLKTLIISKDLGGQTAVSGEIANYPGILMTSGVELSQDMLRHALNEKSVKANIGPQYEISHFLKATDYFTVLTKNGERFQGQTVIVTTGKNPKKLDVEGEKQYSGKGVSYCATCDAPFFNKKTVAVIGGGYSATEATYMLKKYAKKIFVLTIHEKLMGEAVTLEKIKPSAQITIVPHAHTTKIIGDNNKVTAIEYRDSETGECQQIKTDGVFVEIGSVPNTKIFGNLIKLNRWDEIEIDQKNSTRIPGLFAAGDATSIWGKQIVVAAGQGAQAAMAVGEYLSSRKEKNE